MANGTSFNIPTIDPFATMQMPIIETNLPAPAGIPTGPTLWDLIKTAAQRIMNPQGPIYTEMGIINPQPTPPLSIAPTIAKPTTPTKPTGTIPGEISQALGAAAQPQLETTVPTGLVPPYIREPKEGEIPPIQPPKEMPKAIEQPTEPPISGQDYSSLLKFMEPEEYNRQVEEIGKMRPGTVEELVGRAYPTAGPLPSEAAQGTPLQRAMLDFFYGLAGGQGTRGPTVEQWRAGRQAQMEKQWAINQAQAEKKWAQDVEWAKANLDQNQQMAFLKLNRQVQLDDQKRISTSQWLAGRAEMDPNVKDDPNWQRAYATVNRIPMEYVNELIKERTDPKTGKVNMYLDENERFVKNMRAKAEAIKTLMPWLDDEDCKTMALLGKYSDVSDRVKRDVSAKMWTAYKAGNTPEYQKYFEILRELTNINKNLMGQFGEKVDLINAAVKAKVFTPEAGVKLINKALAEMVAPESVKAEGKAKETELKPGELIKAEQLKALKTPSMQIAAKVFPQYAGSKDELARSLEMVQNIMSTGPKTDADRALLGQWKAGQIEYLREQGKGGKDGLIIKLKKVLGELSVQQWQAIADRVGSGYSDAAILAELAPPRPELAPSHKPTKR